MPRSWRSARASGLRRLAAMLGLRRLRAAPIASYMTLWFVACLATAVPPVAAHPFGASAVLVDIGYDVDVELRLPAEELSTAMRRWLLRGQLTRSDKTAVERYVMSHVAATGEDGRRWDVSLATITSRSLHGTPHVVVALQLLPPAEVSTFRLRYDVIVAQVPAHKAFVDVRTHWTEGVLAHDPLSVGVFSRGIDELEIRPDQGAWWKGARAVGLLGVRHITQGADHLLFLWMLLLPTFFAARHGRWEALRPSPANVRRIAHVVTAFAVGHSITLAAATLDLVEIRADVVEILIVVSVGLAAIHALRPFVRGGELIIAAVFGLVHGLGFAQLLADLGLERAAVIPSLLAFNLGIELGQLLVVALVMPAMYLIALSRLGPAARNIGAIVGLAAAVTWVLERGGVAPNPLGFVTTALVDQPFAIVGTITVVALTARRLCPAPEPPAGAPAAPRSVAAEMGSSGA